VDRSEIPEAEGKIEEMKCPRLIVFALLANYPSFAVAEMKLIEGTASYRERIAISDSAVLEVGLRDISRADAKAPLIVSVAVKSSGQNPIRFQMMYDDALIDKRGSYAVDAKLIANGRVIFRSTSTHLVLTRGNSNQVEVTMEKMQSPPAGPALSLVGHVWLAEDIDGRGVIDLARSTISFDADGVATGSGGCNSFRGKVVINEPYIEFQPLAATRKACPPALMDQEQKFFAAFGKAKTFEIIDSERKLILKNAAGEPVIKFSLSE